VPVGLTRDEYLFSLAVPSQPNEFLNTWPSGLMRDPSLGPAWETSGPGITLDEYKPVVLALGISLEVAQAANDIVSVDLGGDVISVGAMPPGHTNGRLRASDGTEWALTNADFCARPGGCACPAGSARSGGTELPSIAPGAALLVVTGHVPTQAEPTSGSRLTVSSRDLSVFCAESPSGSQVVPPATATTVIRGVYVTQDIGKPIQSYALSSPSIDGVLLRVYWSDIEPAPGQFNFVSLDSDIRSVTAVGKYYALAIIAGGYTPSWVSSAGTRLLPFTVSPHGGKGIADPSTSRSRGMAPT
jgi:hypothetical protein